MKKNRTNIILSLISAVMSMGSTASAYDLYVTGNNEFGKFGLGHVDPVESLILSRSDVAQVAFSERTGFILLNNGDLYSAGAWSYGGLGRGAVEAAGDPDYSDPNWGFVMGNVRHVSTKGEGYAVVVVTNDNRLLGSGASHDGKFGALYDTGYISYTPGFVEIDTNVMTAEMGWAPNTYGYIAWIKLTGELFVMGSAQADAYSLGPNQFVYAPFQLASNVRSVYTSRNKTLWITNDNVLWGVGESYSHAFGTALIVEPNPVQIATNVASVSPQYGRTMWLDLSGDAWFLGDSSLFEAGYAAWDDISSPYQMGTGVATLCSSYYGGTYMIYPDGSMDVSGLGQPDMLTLGAGVYAAESFTRSPLTRVASVSAESLFNAGFLVSPAPEDPIDPAPVVTNFERSETRKLTTVTNAYWVVDSADLLADDAQWQSAGALPKGLRLQDGVVRGMISSPGVYAFVIEGTDGVKNLKVTYNLSVVAPTMTPLISDVICNGVSYTPEILEGPTHGTAAVTELVSLEIPVGVPVEIIFNWDMQKPDYSWRVVGGELPEGLVLDGDTGILSGVPATVGEYTFVVSVKDWRGRAYQWMRVVVK